MHLPEIVIIISISTYTITAENPRVTTSLGVIEGYWAKTVKNKSYIAFDGIPYAIPPLAELRFEEPQPVKPWIGIWKADTEYKCIQYYQYAIKDEEHVIGEEDCLYLNVYTPEVNVTRNYDVVVYIHGGAFMFGSGSVYGHKYILDRDVVFVSLNYRLGPLGFLSTEDETLPGNMGLRDQLLALVWVKDNIRCFGGNPNSVTLTGMSAGGASVHIHYISPLSKGLFHRGIAQSGSALNNWVFAENSSKKTRQLGTILGCNVNETTVLIKCLKTRSARQIVNSVRHFHMWLHNPFSPFGVVIDKFSKSPVLPDHPYVLLKSGKFNTNLPLIFSCVQSEGLFPVADFIYESKFFDDINKKWEEVERYVLDFNDTALPNKISFIQNNIRSYYFGNDTIKQETFPTLVKLATDRLFIADIELAAKMHASHENATVYFYYFTYRGAHSKSERQLRNNENFGASHGDDTVYVLSSNVNTRTTPSDIKMTEILLNMWTSYVRNGKPRFEGHDNWWPMYKHFDSDVRYMHIASPEEIKMKTIGSLGNRKFWTSLGLMENEHFNLNITNN